MTPNTTINLLRLLFIGFSLVIGVRVGEVVFDSVQIGAFSGLIFGLCLVLIDRLLLGFSLRVFSAATFGLFLGFLSANLLLASDVLHYTSEQVRWLIGLCTYATFGYIGTMLAVRSNRDEFALVIPYIRFRRTSLQDTPVVVDSSALIDGRLVAVSNAGFLSTSLVIPRFILDEIQQLADSSDPLKREKGRRALDLLDEIQQCPDMMLTIHDSESENATPVDSRLILVSQVLQARLLTNDSNLARIARLEGVTVLNFNDLAAALQPELSTGEELEVTLVKPGRDPHQAVAYLPNGSMIVVNQGRNLLGHRVEVKIAGVLQTLSGRMYFAELKPQNKKSNELSSASAE